MQIDGIRTGICPSLLSTKVEGVVPLDRGNKGGSVESIAMVEYGLREPQCSSVFTTIREDQLSIKPNIAARWRLLSQKPRLEV